MRSCWEMRQDAWKIMTGSKWGWKILLNGIVLYAIMIAVVVVRKGRDPRVVLWCVRRLRKAS